MHEICEAPSRIQKEISHRNKFYKWNKQLLFNFSCLFWAILNYSQLSDTV